MSRVGLFSRRSKSEAATPEVPAGVLVPLLSGQAWIDANAEIFARIPEFPAESVPYSVPWVDGLHVAYAADPDGSWVFTSQGEVNGLGGADAVASTALTNLRRRVAGQIQFVGGPERYRFTVSSEADLSSSLLLVPDLWCPAVTITGPLVVAAPLGLVS